MNLEDSYQITDLTNIREIPGDPLILVNPYIAKRVLLPKDPDNVMRLTIALIKEKNSINEMISKISNIGNLDKESQKILQIQLCSFLSRLENLKIIKRCE